MHSGALPPGGVALEVDHKPDGVWIKSDVYEPGAMLQVEKRGFKAYSVGIAQPRIVRDAKAKNGRIVGGKIVEVSLVDYPANPNCKFAIVDKMQPAFVGKTFVMKDGKFNEDDDGDKVECDACKGSGMVDGAKCTKCHGSKYMAKEAAYEPIERGKELKRVVKAWDPNRPDALSYRAFVKREALRLGRQDILPEDWKEVSITLQKKADIEYAAQRLHDLTCQAYSPEAVKEAYPGIEKDGIAQAVGPNAALALWQLIQNETVEDGGTGKNAQHLEALGKAYAALREFLATEGVDAVYAEVMPELNKLFADINKDILNVNNNPVPTPLSPNAGFGSAHGNVGGAPDRLAGNEQGDGILQPSPGMPSAENASGSVTPSKFRRGFLSAGHQRQTGEGASASPAMPANVGSGGVTPKSRDYLSDGHARRSPGDAKRAGMNLVTQLHDALVIAFPNVSCCLDPRDPAEAPKNAPSDVFGGATSPLLGGASKRAKKAARKAAKKAKKEAGRSIATATANGATTSELTKLAVPGDMDIPKARKAAKKIKKLKKRAKKASKLAKQVKKLKKLKKITKQDKPGFRGGDQKEPAGVDQPEHGQAASAAQADRPVGMVPGAAGETKPGKKGKKKSKKAKLNKTLAAVKKLKKQLAQTTVIKGPARRETPVTKSASAEAQKRAEADVQKREAIEKRARLEHQAFHDPDVQARDRAQQELMRLDKEASAS
jgi:hypothetical protein